MRPCTAGQKRFSFRVSQMTQLTADSFKHYDTHDEVAGSTDRRQKTAAHRTSILGLGQPRLFPLAISVRMSAPGEPPETCLRGPFGTGRLRETRFYRLFQTPVLKIPHKMRLKCFFSTGALL